MGTSRVPTSNQYYAHGPQSGKSGNQSSAVESSHRGLGLEERQRDRNAITYTASFEVTRGLDRDDEEQLVRMDDLSFKGRRLNSSRSSEVSISGATPPAKPR
jgi:hypothetical protein